MPATPNRTPRATHLPRLMAIAAATLAVAAAVPATLAHAAPSATVSPGTVSPGDRVTLNIAGCGTNTGRASSRAFGDVWLTPGNQQATNLIGAATTYRNISAGSHPVTFECGGQRITVALNISPGAARGGLGGSVDSMSPGQIAMGGALAAGGLGAGIWMLRRRSGRSA
ncbi:hypothetical protein [Streptomyces sp. NPDC051183]|uniref:hypothetical protein n=1 Tax=unclassified Streptomyces TaxID=2593676 RepID=UPI00341497C8